MLRPSTLLAAIAASALVAIALPAQTTFPVGYKNLSLPNSGPGSRQLAVQVFYPATKVGKDTPLLKHPVAWPTVVFLHGFNKLGRDYVELGFALAENGFVAAMSDTAPVELQLQIQDGVALHGALAKENLRKGSFFEGQMLTARMALLGHSTGASHVSHVLAQNPGYVAGVAYGPYRGMDLKYTKDVGGKVRVPMLVIGGTGEKVTPWKEHVLGFYQELLQPSLLKELYTLDDDANHYNIVAWLLGTNPRDHEVFDATQRVAMGFLRASIEGRVEDLDAAYGLMARREKRLSSILLDVNDPLLFRTGSAQIGQRSEFQLAARAGETLWMTSLRSAAIPTQWGLLRLDPLFLAFLGFTKVDASRFFVLPLPVPNDTGLVGLSFHVQAAASGHGGLRLSSVAVLKVSR